MRQITLLKLTTGQFEISKRSVETMSFRLFLSETEGTEMSEAYEVE